MKHAHTLQEIVDAGWAPSVLFLQRRLRRKEISGCKVGREWLLSDEDFEAYIESKRNKPVQVDDTEAPRTGLTLASMRRRAS
jgi:hypothetical protein